MKKINFSNNPQRHTTNENPLNKPKPSSDFLDLLENQIMVKKPEQPASH